MAKFIDKKYELYTLSDGSELSVLRHIERCGRNCYKSEANITEESAVKFITGILKSGHESVIEHIHYIFRMEANDMFKLLNIIDIDIFTAVRGLNITKAAFIKDGRALCYYVISGNPRTFRDLYRLSNISLFLDKLPSIFWTGLNQQGKVIADIDSLELAGINRSGYGDKHNYFTFRYDTDIGVYKDVTRHRNLSFSIESTRFCSYNKDKFNNEIKFVKCNDFMTKEANEVYIESCKSAEDYYMKMSKLDEVKPDMLRMILPHGTAASVVMSGSVYDLEKMFNLRCDTHAHPHVQTDMKALRELMRKEYNK